MLTDLPQPCANERLKRELDFLFQRINYERTTDVTYPRHFKLESMRRLLHQMGDPQNEFDIIHVAGTKGKGSVGKMIATALDESGILTGIYSSPHIETLNERFSVGGKPITDAQLAALLERTRNAVQTLDDIADTEGFRKNSFFEIITAAGLLHFRQAGVQKVVLEVGLGGRLDSTNVCEPELCIVTNISLDHTRQLGTTVDRIAREKAGIIKRGIPVISGVRDPVAAREIRETSAVCDAALFEVDRHFNSRINSINDRRLSINFETGGTLSDEFSYRVEDIELNSPGKHQVDNAAIAIAALKWLSQGDPEITDDAIRRSLARFSLIGRSEVLCREPFVVVDMAHNVASTEALADSLRRIQTTDDEASYKKRILMFASSRDKDLPGMLFRLLGVFDEVIFTRFVENPRSTDPQLLLETARQVLEHADQVPQMSIEPNPVLAWQAIRSRLNANDLLCVAGSAFLVAEVRPLIVVDLNVGVR